MKALKLILLAVITITFSACSNDDDSNNNTSEDSILGTWNGTSVMYTGTSEVTANGITITSNFEGVGYDYNFTVTFNENPNEVTSEGSYSIELTTTVQGQTITQNIENLNFSEVGEWELNNDELTVTNNGEASTATIVELSETSLILNVVDVEMINQGGATSTVTTDSTFEFMR